MRLFWAIELPPEAKTSLSRAQDALRERCPQTRVSWVPDSRMHLTLKFLGECPEKQAGRVIEAAQESVQPVNLALELTKLGSFGGRQPRVLWAGVGGPDLEQLAELAERLDQAMVPLGFAAETRSFRPHVTLGRVRPPRKGASAKRGRSPLPEALQQVPFASQSFRAEELVLFSSSQGEERGPPIYTALTRLALLPTGEAT